LNVREWVSLNGRLMPAEHAQVSVFDSGFMQGVGLFETLRAYAGRAFRLDRHLARLINSARQLGWTVLPDEDDLRENVEQVVGATEQEDARVRLTVTTGTLRPTEQDTPELTVVATASPGAKYPPECYIQGVTVLVSDYRQGQHDPTAGHKTTSYFSRLASLREAHAQGAFEALWFTYDQHLAEGAISSVFIVEDERLLTPPLDTPVLPGITRATVIELAVELGVPVREQTLTIKELLEADEAFLTNSLMELVPVVRVEREPIGSEKPGETTRQLYEAYRALVERECLHG
jgi:branched-subunit amino acid aminotransferase/4-amino-4-deoxychorismate lyase